MPGNTCGFEGMEAFDDVTGQALDPALMVQARKDEIEYFRSMGVYEKVDVQECWNVLGKAPIGVHWVDINKGESGKPNYRSRLAARSTLECAQSYMQQHRRVSV